MPDLPILDCACPTTAERACGNPVCPRQPTHLREVAPFTGTYGGVDLPAGLRQLRRTLLRGVRAHDVLRSAGACRNEARNIRRQITRGAADPAWVPQMEDRVVSLALMEGVLATLGRLLREAERRHGVSEGSEETPAPFVSFGDAAAAAVERVAALMEGEAA